MQAARAVTDVATEMINTVCLRAGLGHRLGDLLLVVDRLWHRAGAGGLAGGLFADPLLHAARAGQTRPPAPPPRAMVSGQVVDTITNIKTVKLFAHAAFEDRVALDAMEVFRDRSLEFGVISTWFRFGADDAGGVLPVLLIGGTVLLWQQGRPRPATSPPRGHRDADRADVGLGQLYADVDLHQRGRGRGRHAHPVRSPHAGRRARRPTCRASRARSVRRMSASPMAASAAGAATSPDHPAGEKLGIVGASGAGKSSLVSLLLRLYDPEEGPRADRRPDVRAVTQESLRRQIGMVTQETAMFNRSARDNILTAAPTPPRRDVEPPRRPPRRMTSSST
jgi:ATP-binding cassette, subfamily B, bacterial